MSTARIEIDAPLTIGAQIEARAQHPDLADRVFVFDAERSWTYRDLRDQSLRFAHFLMGRLGESTSDRPGHVAMMLENHLELVALYGGCAYAGLTLFGLNTGLRGEVLAGVLNQSRARLLVVDEIFLDRIDRIRDDLEHLGVSDILVLRRHEGARESNSVPREADLLACIDAEVTGTLSPPNVVVDPSDVHMVIYTSGTTGLPKGINNSHLKLLMIGKVVAARMELTPDDCGYACMPLFHSNAIFLGLHPAFEVGGRVFVRTRFSASAFASDVLEHGVSYWNYVGEPVHYILGAVEQRYGGDERRIRKELAGDPRNRLAIALGNGAAPPDIDRFIDWFGLEDMFELYGSTEAAISTFRTRGDPRGSVGEIGDPAVKILDGSGRECPPAVLDDDGKILNYDDAVGEICRVAPDSSFFQGYFDNEAATSAKYREGVYHSGDLGHVLERDGKRYLYFDGRTEDWIRKDGENFSAMQVARILQEHPTVMLAVAFGVPCAVSDEHVMAVIKLQPGATFDGQAFFDFCQEQVVHGGMDPKWFPDYVRIVEEFPYTETQKVLVRNLRQQHFGPEAIAEGRVFFRTRESKRFEPFGAADYERLREHFAAREREHLL